MEIRTMEVVSGGFLLSFTKPVGSTDELDIATFSLEHYRYPTNSVDTLRNLFESAGLQVLRLDDGALTECVKACSMEHVAVFRRQPARSQCGRRCETGY